MRPPRVTIGGLMGLVLVVAVGTAALRSPSALWVSIVLTIALGMLLAAVFGIVYRRGAARAYWAGFAVFGGSYLLVSYGPWLDTTVTPHLLTTRALAELHDLMYKTDRFGSKPITYYNYKDSGYITINTWEYWRAHREYFFQVGHALAGLMAALVGGVVARWFYASGPDRGRPSAQDAS
jgi:hypothetical protein